MLMLGLSLLSPEMQSFLSISSTEMKKRTILEFDLLFSFIFFVKKKKDQVQCAEGEGNGGDVVDALEYGQILRYDSCRWGRTPQMRF